MAEAILLRIFPCRFLHGSFFTAVFPWQFFHGSFCTAVFPRQFFRGSHWKKPWTSLKAVKNTPGQFFIGRCWEKPCDTPIKRTFLVTFIVHGKKFKACLQFSYGTNQYSKSLATGKLRLVISVSLLRTSFHGQSRTKKSTNARRVDVSWFFQLLMLLLSSHGILVHQLTPSRLKL